MTPEEAIADLDAALLSDGEDIILRRLTLAGTEGLQIPFAVKCRAFVRGYQLNELVNGITQQDAKVILSPTQIIGAGWRSSASVPAGHDGRVPVKGNETDIAGKTRQVEAAVGIYIANELVRIEMRVLG